MPYEPDPISTGIMDALSFGLGVAGEFGMRPNLEGTPRQPTQKNPQSRLGLPNGPVPNLDGGPGGASTGSTFLTKLAGGLGISPHLMPGFGTSKPGVPIPPPVKGGAATLTPGTEVFGRASPVPPLTSRSAPHLEGESAPPPAVPLPTSLKVGEAPALNRGTESGSPGGVLPRSPEVRAANVEGAGGPETPGGALPRSPQQRAANLEGAGGPETPSVALPRSPQQRAANLQGAGGPKTPSVALPQKVAGGEPNLNEGAGAVPSRAPSLPKLDLGEPFTPETVLGGRPPVTPPSPPPRADGAPSRPPGEVTVQHGQSGPQVHGQSEPVLGSGLGHAPPPTPPRTAPQQRVDSPLPRSGFEPNAPPTPPHTPPPQRADPPLPRSGLESNALPTSPHTPPPEPHGDAPVPRSDAGLEPNALRPAPPHSAPEAQHVDPRLSRSDAGPEPKASAPAPPRDAPGAQHVDPRLSRSEVGPEPIAPPKPQDSAISQPVTAVVKYRPFRWAPQDPRPASPGEELAKAKDPVAVGDERVGGQATAGPPSASVKDGEASAGPMAKGPARPKPPPLAHSVTETGYGVGPRGEPTPLVDRPAHPTIQRITVSDKISDLGAKAVADRIIARNPSRVPFMVDRGKPMTSDAAKALASSSGHPVVVRDQHLEGVVTPEHNALGLRNGSKGYEPGFGLDGASDVVFYPGRSHMPAPPQRASVGFGTAASKGVVRVSAAQDRPADLYGDADRPPFAATLEDHNPFVNADINVDGVEVRIGASPTEAGVELYVRGDHVGSAGSKPAGGGLRSAGHEPRVDAGPGVPAKAADAYVAFIRSREPGFSFTFEPNRPITAAEAASLASTSKVVVDTVARNVDGKIGRDIKGAAGYAEDYVRVRNIADANVIRFTPSGDRTIELSRPQRLGAYGEKPATDPAGNEFLWDRELQRNPVPQSISRGDKGSVDLIDTAGGFDLVKGDLRPPDRDPDVPPPHPSFARVGVDRALDRDVVAKVAADLQLGHGELPHAFDFDERITADEAHVQAKELGSPIFVDGRNRVGPVAIEHNVIGLHRTGNAFEAKFGLDGATDYLFLPGPGRSLPRPAAEILHGDAVVGSDRTPAPLVGGLAPAQRRQRPARPAGAAA